MLYEPKVGRPCELTPEVHARIIESAKKVIVPNQVAANAKIPKSTFYLWLEKGAKDQEEGLSTCYTQLMEEYLFVISEIVSEILLELRGRPNNYPPLMWILERCFRKDFGQDSEIIQKIMDNFEKLKQGQGAA